MLGSGVQAPLSFMSLHSNNHFNFVAAVTRVNYRSFLDLCHFDGFHPGADAKTAPLFEHKEALSSCGPDIAARAMAVTFLFISAAAAALCLGFGDLSLQRATAGRKAEPEESEENL